MSGTLGKYNCDKDVVGCRTIQFHLATLRISLKMEACVSTEHQAWREVKVYSVKRWYEETD